jgi:hypothetical protein
MPTAQSMPQASGLRRSRSSSAVGTSGASGGVAGMVQRVSRASPTVNEDGLHHGSRGKRVLPAAPVGSLAASIASGRPKRKKPANNPPLVPTTTAYRELHSRNFTILRKQVPASTCAMLRESAAREAYKPILGDKLRLYAADATSAPLVSRLLDQVLDIRVGVKVDFL